MTSRVGRCEGLVHDDCSLPSSLPSITYSVLWAEQTTHWGLLHTVFKWADDAQKAFFLSAGHPGTVLQKLYFERAVMRSVTVEVANSEPHAVADQVIVFSWISKVGRTSWQSSTEIRCKNQLVARAVTTMVAMDHALETTVPVPHAAELREMVQKAADVSSVEVKENLLQSYAPPPVYLSPFLRSPLGHQLRTFGSLWFVSRIATLSVMSRTPSIPSWHWRPGL